MAIVCNRLNITGPVCERTPLIVLKEIAIAHHINYDDLQINNSNYIRGIIKTIYSHPAYQISPPFTNNGLNTLKRYLGVSDEEWGEQDLNLVYSYWSHIISTLERHERVTIEYIGSPSRNCPYSLNACFLYRICKNANIDLPFNISFDTLAVTAKMSTANANSIIEIINPMLLQGNLNDILSLLSSVNGRYLNSHVPPKSWIIPEQVTCEMLQTLARNRTFVAQKRTATPQNNTEAIALAAFNYNINLFHAQNPLREYFIIKSNHNQSDYTPADIAMRTIYQKNDNLIRLKLFEPKIPLEFYAQTTLLTAVENEGYNRSELELESPYELLQVAFLSETFHHGWFPNISNTETPFLFENLSDVSKEDLICFGCRSDRVIGISLDELIGMFRSNGNFINSLPGSTGLFSPTAIRKLRIICSVIETEKSSECLRELDAIDSLNSTGSESLRLFLNEYRNASVEQQSNIRVVLKNLVDMAMFMRGWDGVSQERYPPNTPVDNQSNVDIRVTEAVYRFEQSLRLLGNSLENIVRSLPILKYDRSTFIVSNSNDEGKTLGERFDLMKRGNNDSNINGCIRLTSNWFAASAYRYYQVLRLPVPFDIEQLRWIL